MVNEELFRAGLGLGLAMGGKSPELLKRIEAFIEEVEKLGVEVKITVNVGGAAK